MFFLLQLAIEDEKLEWFCARKSTKISMLLHKYSFKEDHGHFFGVTYTIYSMAPSIYLRQADRATILLRGIQFTHVQHYLGSTVGVRCAHFPSVITTRLDQKVQLVKLLN
jgi:hypothetical protein